MQLKNEQVNSDIVDIMDKLHDYVPKRTIEETFKVPEKGISVKYKIDNMHGILFGGDQLTCSRA